MTAERAAGPTVPAGNPRWLGAAILLAIAYPVAGIVFGALGNPAVSNSSRVAWRLAAWLVAAAIFAAHVAYEHRRLRSSPPRAALHVAIAVSLGAFLLAAWVNTRPARSASSRRSPLAPLAFIVFPAVAGVPAYFVALAATTVLARKGG